jgi:hypothetical protein
VVKRAGAPPFTAFGVLVCALILGGARAAIAGGAPVSLSGGKASTASPTPVSLILPQSNAFAILGHSCGGIQEKAYVTGFDPATGYPTGYVYLQTRCSTGGRGGGTITYSAWSAVTWNLAGSAVSSTVASAPAVDPTFSATDAYGDQIYNANNAAYLIVPAPGVPTIVSAVQSGDQFQVSWAPNASTNPAAIASSVITAQPLNRDVSIVTTVSGSAATALVGPLQPKTTYQISVQSTTIGGTSPFSKPVTLMTVAPSIPPSVPANVMAHWAGQGVTTATLVATWNASVPGDSPVDQYEITITGSDGGGTFTQSVSGAVLTASFVVDWIPNWSVTVRAHNAFGWGQGSAPITLGGL